MFWPFDRNLRPQNVHGRAKLDLLQARLIGAL